MESYPVPRGTKSIPKVLTHPIPFTGGVFFKTALTKLGSIEEHGSESDIFLESNSWDQNGHRYPTKTKSFLKMLQCVFERKLYHWTTESLRMGPLVEVTFGHTLFRFKSMFSTRNLKTYGKLPVAIIFQPNSATDETEVGPTSGYTQVYHNW